MPDNPNWPFGYVPSPQEWNEQFANKVDYPASPSQGGTGGESAPAGWYNLAQRYVVTSAQSPFSAAPLAFHGLMTGTGAITINLPALDTLLPGDWVEVADIDFNANTNNVTIEAAGSDVIAAYGSSAGSQVLSVAGAWVKLVVNAASWRMLV